MKIVVKDFGTTNVHYKAEIDSYTLQSGESFDSTLDILIAKGKDILTIEQLRNQIIDDHLPNWGTMSDADKKKLIERHVWDSAATTSELDALYSSGQRDAFRDKIINQYRAISCMITKSTTSESSKFINWTCDDTPTSTLKIIEPHLKI